MPTDIHFDRLAERFQRNIYGTLKGDIRLALLEEDLDPWLRLPATRVLDVGGGSGRISALFARHGHEVTLVDAAAPMLEQAREFLAGQSLDGRVDLRQATLQQLAGGHERWPLVVCHAVLEWLADPRQAVAGLAGLLEPGGRLSLMFYNRHALEFRHLHNGQIERVMSGDIAGDGSKLTPTSPVDPDALYDWVRAEGLEILDVAGVRSVFDHLPRSRRDTMDLKTALALERPRRRRQPWLHLARYIHLMAVRP